MPVAASQGPSRIVRLDSTTDRTHMSPVWPLCFKYTGPVFGNGFVAHVELSGRVLAIQETDGVWFNGVTPAAIAVSAATLKDAGPVHRDAMTKVFIDFAEESKTFEEFEAKVQAFYDQGDDDLKEWKNAVARINAGLEAIPEGLRRCKDPEIYLKVTRRQMDQVTPADNPLLQTNPDYASAA